MVNGVQMTLMIGPGVPLPVPKEVVEALTEVKVIASSGETASGFELTFNLSRRSPLHTVFLLSGGSAIPVVRVVIIVTVNGRADVLMDGMMTHYEVQTGAAGGQTQLTVKGKDLTALMDYIDFSGLPYPAMPPALRVLLVLAKYAQFGIIPLVIPSILEDIPLPIDRIPSHQGKDLEYVQKLALEAGYVFYLDPGPMPGTSVAYWGPEIKVGPAQPALNADMDAHRNVESLTFRYDKERKEMPIVYLHEPISKVSIPIPIPDISPLSPPLGLVPPIPPKITILEDTAKMSPLNAALHGISYAARHSDVVFGEGSLDVTRYGRILKSRQLVGVRGAGEGFDGLHYVRSVTHRIKRGEYKQNFSLSRNGLLSTTPKVPA